ncbi:MAG: glycosyltransferase family 39 protein [Bacteroidales bacterium]|nr:glycosyltransferase family 39 protein [Bacteroidales bacterium]
MKKKFKEKIKSKENLKTTFFILVLIVMSYFVFINQLGNRTLHIWDESRNAISAYEVSKNGSYLMPTFNEQIDMWNTKPPLLISCQAICIKIFGNNEFAVRLPSALASSLTAILIFLVLSSLTKSKPLAFLTSCVFLTLPGILQYHALRQGDFEAFLVFFSAAYALVFLYYLETKKTNFLYFSMALFTLAFLSKSSASLFFLPGIGIYILLKKELVNLLKSKHFYFSILIPIITLGGYYLIREIYNTGYIKAVYENEFGGRALNAIEGHTKPFNFYYKYLTDYVLGWWYYLIPVGVVLTFFEKSKKIRNIFIFSFIMAATHLLLISVSQTKLEWYCFPQVVFWAILSGISIYQIVNLILFWTKNNQIKSYIQITVFALIIYYPFSNQLKIVNFISTEESWNTNVKVFLRDKLPELNIDKEKQISFISEEYLQNSLFYIYQLRDKGYNIEYGDFVKLKENSYFIVDGNDEQKFVEAYSFCATIDTIEIYTDNIKMYYLHKYNTYNESIEFVKNLIISDVEYNNYIIEKAKTNAIDYETQLENDANYIITNAQTKIGKTD